MNKIFGTKSVGFFMLCFFAFSFSFLPLSHSEASEKKKAGLLDFLEIKQLLDSFNDSLLKEIAQLNVQADISKMLLNESETLSFVNFMEDRIADFATKNKTLSPFYLKRLTALLDTTKSLIMEKKLELEKRKLISAPPISLVSESPVFTKKYGDIDYFSHLDPVLSKRLIIISDALGSYKTPSPPKKHDKKTDFSYLPPVLSKPDKTVKDKDKPQQTVMDDKILAPVSLSKPKSHALFQPSPYVFSDSGEHFRPLAVMIENHSKARPQTGLDKAELLYEFPVEGGITRFMALYRKPPKTAGPVRSCRDYFVDRALESDAFYIHCGGSPAGYTRITQTGIVAVDEIKRSKPFFRDNSRKAPHNLYLKGETIYPYLQSMGQKIKSAKSVPLFPETHASPKLTAEKVSSFVLKYRQNYEVKVSYADGKYLRYMNDKLHLDKESGKPLQGDAVVVQIASAKVLDEAGRLEINFISSGEAFIFADGFSSKARWEKKSPRDFTRYYLDGTGQEYKFKPNTRLWIFSIPAAKNFILLNEADKS